MSFPGPSQGLSQEWSPAAPSRAARGRSAPASLVPLIGMVLVAVLVYIALSVVLAPPSIVDQNGTALPYNFKSERGTITLLSTCMFLLAACFSYRALRLVWAEGGRSRMLWLALTTVMAYFTVDEVAQFHERTGDFLDHHAPLGPFRTYNDVIVIAYGVALLPLALLLWREVLRLPRFFTMLVITGGLYVATSGVDTLMTSASPVSTITEESVKIYCSTFFALSMLTGLVAVRWAGAPRTTAPRGAGDTRAAGGVLTMWGGLLGLMSFIGLMVAIIGKPALRIPLVWVAALLLGALVVRVLPRVDGVADAALPVPPSPDRPAQPGERAARRADRAAGGADRVAGDADRAAGVADRVGEPAGRGLFPPVRAVVAIYLPPVLLLSFFLLLHAITHVDFGLISRDQAQEFTHLPADAYASMKAFPLIGFQSTISGLIWFSAFTVSVLTLLLLHRRGELGRLQSRFLAAVSALTLIMGADDIFMFHDELAPRYLKVLEGPFILFYVGSIVGVLVVFRRQILEMDPVLFLLGVAGLAGSIGVDHFQEQLDWWPYRIFAEDGFKFLGIVGWCGYLIRECWLVIISTPGAVAQVPAPSVPRSVPSPVLPAALSGARAPEWGAPASGGVPAYGGTPERGGVPAYGGTPASGGWGAQPPAERAYPQARWPQQAPSSTVDLTAAEPVVLAAPPRERQEWWETL